MGPERLELSHIAALDPKSSASTNFATGPWVYSIVIYLGSGEIGDYRINPSTCPLQNLTFSQLLWGPCHRPMFIYLIINFFGLWLNGRRSLPPLLQSLTFSQLSLGRVPRSLVPYLQIYPKQALMSS